MRIVLSGLKLGVSHQALRIGWVCEKTRYRGNYL